MPRRQAVLTSGHVFDADLVTRQVEGHEVALAIASNRDPIHDVIVTQTLIQIDGAEVLRKTLRVEGRSCDALIDFGPELGDGRLTLHWALMPQAGGYLAHGHGDWNGADLEEFAVSLVTDADGLMKPEGDRPMAALRLDSGGFAEPTAADPATVAALAAFLAQMRSEPSRATGCVTGCLERATGRVLAAAALALDPEAPLPPASIQIGTIIESSCLTACARAAGH